MKKIVKPLAFVFTAYCLLITDDCKSQIITTFAGTGAAGYSGDDSLAINAKFNNPMAVKFDAAGNLYIADYFNHRVRMINTSGIITTVAGNGIGGNTGDGGQATGAEIAVEDIAFDASENLCIGSFNFVRLVNASSGVITSVVGSPGSQVSSGNGGPATAAHIGEAYAVTYDSLGNLYIADIYYGNNNIRKVNTLGIISTLGGGGPYEGLVIGHGGYLYVSGNGFIHKVNDISGTGITFVGTGTPGYSGDNGQAINAQVDYPHGMVFDAVGNLFFADRGTCNCVRKVDVSGIITTIVGAGTAGYSGDGGLATAAELNSPYGITLDAFGNLYIADLGNNRIRMVSNVGAMGIKQVTSSNEQVTVCPNPAANMVQVAFAGNIININVYDVLGKEIISTKEKEIDVSVLNEGVYFVEIKTSEGIVTKKIIVQR